MKKKSVVLLSGGLDSSVNLYAANRDSDVILAITFDYGQRAFSKENQASIDLCQKLKIPHRTIELPWLSKITDTSLVNKANQVPVGIHVQINSLETSLETAKAVWVPNRNGVFLNIAAAFAEFLGAQNIVVGFNAEEAQTFPDNSVAFIDCINKSFSYSTANQARVLCYTANMNKTEIVKLGINLELKFHLVWPCYFSEKQICRECESCQRFLRAIKTVGVEV